MDQVMIGDIKSIKDGVGVVLGEREQDVSAYFTPTPEHRVGVKIQYVVRDTPAGPEAKRIMVLIEPERLKELRQ